MLRYVYRVIYWVDRCIALFCDLIIRIYQYILSPDHSIWARALDRPPYCKHIPSCSAYAREALRIHGGCRGCWMAFRRVLRCHPWSKGGYDPVCMSDQIKKR